MENTKSIFNDQIRRQHQQDETNIQITYEHLLFIVGLIVIFFLRLSNLNYNTLFLDEAINALVGEDYLAREFGRHALQYHFGSYLYPVLAGTLNELGGVIALRFGAAITTTAASIFIYLATRFVFDERAAFFAMLLFGLTGASISLGQLAVYDSLSIPFLALSLYLVIHHAWNDERAPYILLASSGAMIAAILAKYIGLIYFPAVLITGFVLCIARDRPVQTTIKSYFIYWLIPAGTILGAYGIYNYSDLVQVATQQGFTAAKSAEIIAVTLREIGPAIALAMAGAIIIFLHLLRLRDNANLELDQRQGSLFYHRPGLYRVAISLILLLVIISFLAAPIYHILDYNIRSLWKNLVYSLIFLAPLGGYFLSSIIGIGERISERPTRLVALLVLFVLTVLFVGYSLDLHDSHKYGWPNVENLVTYLKGAGLNQNSRVFAEAAPIFEYYHNMDTSDRLIWSSAWYGYYQVSEIPGRETEILEGPEVIELGIQNQFYDFVIVDDYYAPGTRQRLDPVLAEAGYQVTYDEEQMLPDGEIILLQVFEPEN